MSSAKPAVPRRRSAARPDRRPGRGPSRDARHRSGHDRAARQRLLPAAAGSRPRRPCRSRRRRRCRACPTRRRLRSSRRPRPMRRRARPFGPPDIPPDDHPLGRADAQYFRRPAPTGLQSPTRPLGLDQCRSPALAAGGFAPDGASGRHRYSLIPRFARRPNSPRSRQGTSRLRAGMARRSDAGALRAGEGSTISISSATTGSRASP